MPQIFLIQKDQQYNPIESLLFPHYFILNVCIPIMFVEKIPFWACLGNSDDLIYTFTLHLVM